MTELYGLGYQQGGYSPLAEAEEPTAAVRAPTPSLSVLVDFEHDINPQEELPEPTWTEIVAYVNGTQGFETRRGRARTLDRNEAGTFSVLVNDPDGDFDPDNDASPFYPNVVPMRRIRAQGLTTSPYEPFITGESSTGDTDVVGGGPGDIATTIFDGLIESWRYTYPGKGRYGLVEIGATDWQAALARESVDWDMPTALQDPLGNPEAFEEAVYGVYAVNRIIGILDRKPFARHDIRRDYPEQPDYPRSHQVVILNYDDAGMLDAIGVAADIDGGNFFAGRDGVFVYRDPEWQYRPLDERLTFARGVNEFADVVFDYDDSSLANVIEISSDAGVSTFTDQPSVDRFFRRTKSYNLPFADNDELTERGDELLARYSQPQRVISSLDLSNVVSDWTLILGLELWDKVLLRVTLPGGRVHEQLSLVEGIGFSSPNQRDWRVSLWLSAAPFTNLLTDTYGDFETGIDGWVAETNCTLSQEAGGTHGRYCLGIEATNDGDVSARTLSVAVDPRVAYRASFKASAFGAGLGAAGYDAHLELEWRDSADALLSTLIGETVSIRTFKLLQVSGTSPAGAAGARLRVVIEDLDEPSPLPIFQGARLDGGSLTRTR